MTKASPDTALPAIPATGTLNKLLAGQLTLPEDITRVINVQSWAMSLITHEIYAEPDPDYLQKMLLIQTLTAETIDEMFRQDKVRKLQDAIPNVPGAGTGPIEITGVYVTTSDFGEGAPTYLIIDTRHLEHGLEVKYTTGAQQIQAQALVAICLGMWPLKCQITRTDRKDRGERYMFSLIPPDTTQ